jgi:LCP family protein required for cell wall assembly
MPGPAAAAWDHSGRGTQPMDNHHNAARGDPSPRRREPHPSGAGRRRAVPSPAQSELVHRIAAARRARQRRTLLLTCGLMSALVLLLAGSAWGLSSYVNEAIGRVNAGTSGGTTGPLNVLLAGVDLRTGLTPRQQRMLHVGHAVSFNSDTMMLIHIAADRSSVTVVSLPRDSWVNIPGHGMNKINAAFGLGGPKLMVSTVEQDTGLTINHFVEVNFLGFVTVIDALGGVDICLPQAVDDPYSGLRLGAGIHHVNGVTALKYARDRHSFATSDLARIGNQQSLLASLMSEASSSGTLANPLRLSSFLRSVLGVVKVDQNLNLTALADQLRGITPGEVHFLTVPLSTTNYLTPTGESAVLWNTSAADQIFAAFRADRPVAGTVPGHSARRHRAGPDASRVTVGVYNGTSIVGLSASTGAALARLGFHVHAGLNWPARNITQTLIEYPPGQRAGADVVRKALPAAALRRVPGSSGIRVVLGSSGHTVAGGAPAGAATPPASSRSAAQAACR